MLSIKKHANLLTSIASFIINFFPYLVYILLVNLNDGLLAGVMPLVLFFAFRRTSLFIFFDFRKHSRLLGWIGLISAIFGYTLGLFGQIDHMFWDFSAVFAGIGASIFPAAYRQIKRIKKHLNPKDNTEKIWLVLLILLLTLGVIATTFDKWPILSFVLLIIFGVLGAVGYYFDEIGYSPKIPLRIHPKNLLIVFFLFLAMVLMEYGSKKDIGTDVEWGVFLLLIFLVVLLILLLVNRKKFSNATSRSPFMQMMMYGVCAQFWISYSAIFVTIVYGAKAFVLVFAAYIVGILLSKPLGEFVIRHSILDPFTTIVLGIILGILMTFYFPTYFIGIFIIRSLASYQKSEALEEYEVMTNNYNSSYLVSYYWSSASALLAQAVMWTILISLSSYRGFEKILIAMSKKEISPSSIWVINMTHLGLAIFMIAFAILTWLVYRSEKIKEDS